jgi:glycosyltransferase involved in cell wall biosynthesis
VNDKPLVSVITPFFNTPPPFIKEAIESVIAQSYRNWEILLVDDGSAAESADTARRYAEQYREQIVYLEHEKHQNRGASASRNLGIRHARGEYIALLDADDLWFPHKLEQQVAILGRYPSAVMLYGNTEYWYSWSGNPTDRGRDFIPTLGVEPDRLIDSPKLLPLFLQGQAAVPCTCSILVRRQVMNRIGGFVGAVPIVYDDQVFYAKICLSGAVFVSSACWDRYRQHPNSSCAVAEQTGQMSAIRLSFLRWLAEYLAEQKINDVAVWHALRKQLREYENPGWLHWREMARYLERRSKKLWSRLAGPKRSAHL